MRVAIVTTYPPRPCGIATFTTDLRRALLQADGSTEALVAAVTTGAGQELAPEVALALHQHSRDDYREAAAALNGSGADVVLIQHEYGIYGGNCGEYVLDLVAGLEIPYVVTLHTVLVQPSAQQAAVLRALCHGAAEVTVFSAKARELLAEAGFASPDRVTVLNHGAPVELRRGPAARAWESPGPAAVRGLPELHPHEDRTILSTFGLLSSGKGIEVAIRSLPAVVDAHPDALYVVAGRTHPEVASREGERYRSHLEELTAELGLSSHVLFVNRFLSDEEVQHLLGRTDVFLTPYRSHEQVVSGVLTFALVAGCPVVSTPYLYAADLLCSGGGLLVPFDDHEAMATGVLSLLGDPARRREVAREAHAIGAQHTWPEVGRELLKTLTRASETHERVRAPRLPGRAGEGERCLPDLSHLARLVDSVGIVQHARGVEPDLSTGYCVDDAARLALVAAALLRIDPHRSQVRAMLRTSLSFLDDAWDPDAGMMRNFRAADGSWLDEPHQGDHVGRAVWALGEVSGAAADPWSRTAAERLLGAVLAEPPDLSSPRSVAFMLLGLARRPAARLSERDLRLTAALSDRLVCLYREHRTDDWRWFEDYLTYDNARMPQALLAAAARRDDGTSSTIALEALDWYAQQCHVDSSALALVGNRWRHRTGGGAVGAAEGHADGDEQPLDAAALVEALFEAFLTTGEERYRCGALNAFEWFHGRNRWRLAVYDEATGGCHDGLGAGGVNANEGAESTLAYLQAHLSMLSAGATALGAPA